jgi:hypothetical protein
MKKELSKFIFFFIVGCSSINSSLYPEARQSKLDYLIGPLKEETSLDLVKNDLTRSSSDPSFGVVKVTLLTSPLLFLNSKYKKKKSEIETLTQLNLEIDQFIRYNTCFTLNLSSKDPAAINLDLWNTYLIYLDGKAQMPVSIKNNNGKDYAKAFHQFEGSGFYKSSGR